MTSRAVDNCMRELNNFLRNVIYGDNDFFYSFERVQSYSFGPIRKLSDVFRTALTDGGRKSECEEIIKELTSFAAVEISRLKRSCPETRLSNEDRHEMRNVIQLLWELYLSTQQDIPSDERKTISDLLESIRVFLNDGFIEAGDCPSALVEYFGDIIPEKEESMEKGPPSFIRDESFYQSPPDTVAPPREEFVELFHTAVEGIRSASFEPWLHLSTYKLPDEQIMIPQLEVVRIMDSLMSVWKDLRTADGSVRDATFSILETLLTASGVERDIIFEKVIGYYLKNDGHLPDHEKDIPEFQPRLSRAVNSLGDHNTVQADPDRFSAIQTEILFLLLLAPNTTLPCVVQHCLESKQFVPTVLKILRCCHSLFVIEVATNSSRKMPLLITIIQDIYNRGAERLREPEFVDSLVYLITSLSRRKRTAAKENITGEKDSSEEYSVVDECILDPVDLFQLFIIDRLFRSNVRPEEIRVMLMIMRRLFLSVGSKDCPLVWVTFSDDIVEDDRAIPAVELFLVIHSYLMQYERIGGQDIADLCFQTLKAMGSKLREDDVVFSKEATGFLLEKISSDAWWFRYGVTEWFSHSLSSPKRQVPGGLFHALPESSRERLEEIRVDFEVSPVGCMLYSLFELGLFDVELAMDLLNQGLDLLPLDDLLLDQMALALCDCCSKPFFYQRINALLPLIERIVELVDPRTSIPTVLDKVNDNILVAIRQLKSVSLVGRAAKIASSKVLHIDHKYTKYFPSMSLDLPVDPSRIADQLLQAFCELAKTYVDKEIQLYRALLRKQYKENRTNSLERSRLEERLLTQVVILFNEAVMFSRLCPKDRTPKSLTILVNVLSDYVKEVQGTHSDACLDSKKIDYNKEETVYVWAQPDAPSTIEDDTAAAGDYACSQISGGSSSDSASEAYMIYNYRDPQYNHPMHRQRSGYSSQYEECDGPPSLGADGGYGDCVSEYNLQRIPHFKNQQPDVMGSMRAAAHQISHIPTRNQIERRLTEETHSFQKQNTNYNGGRPRDFNGRSRTGCWNGGNKRM